MPYGSVLPSIQMVKTSRRWSWRALPATVCGAMTHHGRSWGQRVQHHVARRGGVVHVFALVASTGLGLRFTFAFGTPLAVTASGGRLGPCELPPLTLLVI